MTAWADFVADVRVDLKDPQGTKFPEAQLLVWARDAIRDYSGYFPKRISRLSLEATDTDGLLYTLPADFVSVISVEAPQDTFLERREVRPGTRLRSTPFFYSVEGGSIVLGAAPSASEILLTYMAVHDVPADPVGEDPVSFTFTVPDRDMELIRIYTAAKAHERMRMNQARLDRFRDGQKRDDNPLDEEVEDQMRVYREKLYARIPGGAVSLYRPGRVK
jgi:hypothetical protein